MHRGARTIRCVSSTPPLNIAGSKVVGFSRFGSIVGFEAEVSSSVVHSSTSPWVPPVTTLATEDMATGCAAPQVSFK